MHFWFLKFVRLIPGVWFFQKMLDFQNEVVCGFLKLCSWFPKFVAFDFPNGTFDFKISPREDKQISVKVRKCPPLASSPIDDRIMKWIAQTARQSGYTARLLGNGKRCNLTFWPGTLPTVTVVGSVMQNRLFDLLKGHVSASLSIRPS